MAWHKSIRRRGFLEPDGGVRAARARGRPACRGATLVEVMMGMLVMGIVALAALAALLFSYRVSDANLRATTAAAAARSLAEQVTSLDYEALAFTSLPIDFPANNAGSLAIGAWTNRTFDIHNTPAQPADDLALSFRPDISRSLTGTGFACTQVIIRFRWVERAFFTARTRENSITVVRSGVPVY